MQILKYGKRQKQRCCWAKKVIANKKLKITKAKQNLKCGVVVCAHIHMYLYIWKYYI